MATAAPMRPFHLAVVGLALAYHLLLARAATAATTTELLHASVLRHDDATLTLAGRPASSSSTSASTTPPDGAAPRRLDVSAVARGDSTAPATTAPPALPPARSSCVVARVREDIVPAPGGVTRTAAATRKALLLLLLHAVPVLVVPFLPMPLAALAALSALATPVRAGHLSNETCPVTVFDREQLAFCSVYNYRPDGSVERSLPFAGLRRVCHAGSGESRSNCREGQAQVGEPIQSKCRVRTLELSEGQDGRDSWCVLPGHVPPISDPAAAAASGEEVCYVELQHRDHREGYYILCPAADCPYFPFLCCPEFPRDAAVAAAA